MPSLTNSSRARRPHRVRLGVEALEARDVPATIDLTTAGASGSANGALFQQSAPLTNSADFHTFVRMDANGVEQGYNTDGRPVQFNEAVRSRFTHSLQLQDVPTVTIGTETYREFVLNINQTNRRPLLSLDELRIYVANTGNLLGYSTATQQLSGITALYDLDAGGDNTILLSNSLNGSTGLGDAIVLIPNSVFAGASATDFVYLYSKFGVTNAANGSFESWGVKPVVVPPPPPTVPSLSGFVYHDLNTNGIKESGEAGIDGVVIQLWVFNASIMDYEPTGITATTGPDGFYEFTGLTAGVTYALAEEQPVNISDGLDSIGTQGGQVANDFLFDIILDPNEQGMDNNFGEGPPPT